MNKSKNKPKRSNAGIAATAILTAVFSFNVIIASCAVKSDNYLIELGEKFLKDCRLDEAEIEFTKALLTNPENPEAKYYLDEIYKERLRRINNDIAQIDVCPGQTVNFLFRRNDGKSIDCSSCLYTWNFGDGSPQITDTSQPYRGIPQASHFYTKGGKYLVTATADRGSGAYTTGVSDGIYVNVGKPPVADAGPDIKGCSGQKLVFNASHTRNYGPRPLTYIWDFGDGNYDQGRALTHIYQNGGTYNVTLTVRDDTLNSCNTSTDTLKATICQKPEAIIEIK